jgi:hypothetical protein
MQGKSIAAPLSFLFWTAVAQLIALALLVLIYDFYPHRVLALAICSVTAYLVSKLLRLPLPWQILNLILPIGIFFAITMNIPAGLVGAILLGLFLIYIPTFWTRVPFYPTSSAMYNIVADQLPDDQPFHFIDLGCGFGSLLIFLAGRKPLGVFEGVEISPLPYLASKIRFCMKNRARLSVKLRSFWGISLDRFDFVYAFLAPPPMETLWEKVQAEVKPGSLFLVNSFPVNAKAERILEVEDRRKSRLYVYKVVNR